MTARVRFSCFALMVAISLLAAVAFAQTNGKQLFNGKNLDGWQHVGPGSFTVENGVLRSHGGMGLLWYTKEKFGDCRLRVVYKTEKADTNSGVFIRIADKPKDEWFAVHHGYEVQIEDVEDDYHRTGVLYSLTKARAKPVKSAGEWNAMEISLTGPRTVVKVNGEVVTDYTEGQPVPERTQNWEPERGRRPNSGYIGLQNHDDTSTVWFREISIHPLK